MGNVNYPSEESLGGMSRFGITAIFVTVPLLSCPSDCSMCWNTESPTQSAALTTRSDTWSKSSCVAQ